MLYFTLQLFVMGCDFDVRIEVLYGSVWVPIIFFGTKTRCGGYPLCAAVYRLGESRGVDGNHGRHKEPLSSGRNPLPAIIFYKSNQKAKSAIEPPIAPAAKRAKVEEPADDDEDSAWENQFVYYSMEELSLFISEVRNIESRGEAAEIFECNRMLYTRLHEPVLKIWCKMALTAAPLSKEYWMSDSPEYIDKINKKLRSAQDALAAVHKSFMKQFKEQFPLPGHLYDIVVQWCVPVGADIRFGIRDCEGQCDAFVKGKRQQSPPKCVVM